MSKKSLDQERAAYAWKCVQNQPKDYKNLAKSLPALVMSNGLMQTLAFLKAKESQEHHATLGAHVVAWAMTSNKPDPSKNGTAFKSGFHTIMKNLYKMNSSEYRRVTEETLEILRWIRQMADAAIKDKRETDNG